MVTCNRGVLDEHDKSSRNSVQRGRGGSACVLDSSLYMVDIQCYDYSAGYVFGIMKPDNHLPIVL